MSLSQSSREREVLLESTYSLAVVTGLPSCRLCLLASQCNRKHVMLCCCAGVIGLQWDTFVIYLYIYSNVIQQGPVHPLQWVVLALRILLLPSVDDLLLLQSAQIWWLLCLKTINLIIFLFFLFTEGNLRSHNMNGLTVICIAFFKVSDVEVTEKLIVLCIVSWKQEHFDLHLNACSHGLYLYSSDVMEWHFWS